MSALAPTLEAFFTERLLRQRNASPHTVAAYRDTMRLLLRFAHERTHKQPSELDLADLDAPLIAAFLDQLEHERGNSVRTRNARLAAVNSLYRFAALRHPEHAALIQRVLAIPPKRFDRALVSFLTEPEVEALLASPDRSTWTGRRDHALLLLAVETGLRASELTGLNAATSTSASAPTSAATARAENNASPRSPDPPSPPSAPGPANAAAAQPSRSSRPGKADDSAATRSSVGSPNTSATPPGTHRACTTRR